MSRNSLFFLFAMACIAFRAEASIDYCKCTGFYTAIYSSYAYDEKLETKSGRAIIDSTSWTNLGLGGWRPSMCFQPFIGVGAYKLRVVDRVAPTENTVADMDAQGNMTTQPGIAGLIGAEGWLSCLPCNNLLNYRLQYFIANPKMSYAVVRGSIGTNQDIYLLYQQAEAHVAIGRHLGCSFLYFGADFLYTNGNFSTQTVMLTENNTYTLSDYRAQNHVGAIAGVQINPYCSNWHVQLETIFVTHYTVNLEVGLSF